MLMKLAAPLACLALTPWTAGCGPSDPLGRVAVSGTVRVDGIPLKSGAIALEPASGTPTAVGARIRDGSFAIERAQGPVPGRYLVRIYASAREQAPKPPGTGERTRRPMLERIPPEYNARSTLMVDVSRDRTNDLRFDVETSRSGDAGSR